jgi:hypothetical protein
LALARILGLLPGRPAQPFCFLVGVRENLGGLFFGRFDPVVSCALGLGDALVRPCVGLAADLVGRNLGCGQD